MPSETRQIVFQLREAALALRDYSARVGRPFPAGQVAEITFGEGSNLGCVVTIRTGPDDQKALTFSSEAGGAALVFYCINNRIPISSRASKRLARFGDSIGLILDLDCTASGRLKAG